MMFIVSLHQNSLFLLYFRHFAYNQLDYMISSYEKTWALIRIE